MNALSLETSGRTGSIALSRDGALLEETSFAHGLRQAAGLITLIDAACRRQGWRPGDIGRIDVSAGPGSFTGLRIGITAVKTMAWATKARIVAVPSVRVLAENAPADATNLVIVLDAKRGEIFTARFSRSAAGMPWQLEEPAHVGTLAAMLARAPRPVHLLGEGIPFHRAAVPADGSVIETAEDTWRARAAAVARLADGLAAAGEFADAMKLTPIYIRRPEAEEKAEAAGAAHRRRLPLPLEEGASGK